MVLRWLALAWVAVAYEELDTAATIAASAPRWGNRTSHPGTLYGIEKILHRSHRYSPAELSGAARSTDGRLRRVARNVVSCAKANPGFATRWYDDARLEVALDAFAREDPRLEAAVAALRAPPMRKAFVLRADLARLAMIWLDGGFWLDADAACLDDLELHLPEDVRGCVLAWEGSVRDWPSAPLNWALGCPERHAFILEAGILIAERVAHFARAPDMLARAACDRKRGLFCADGDGGQKLPVLNMTGPGALGDALLAYSGRASNRDIREAAGETADDEDTWDAISYVDDGRGDVTILPYCFFRSRGCAHLDANFDDRVLFHHEFDTAWRPTFWHNYIEDGKHPAPALGGGAEEDL